MKYLNTLAVRVLSVLHSDQLNRPFIHEPKHHASVARDSKRQIANERLGQMLGMQQWVVRVALQEWYQLRARDKYRQVLTYLSTNLFREALNFLKGTRSEPQFEHVGYLSPNTRASVLPPTSFPLFAARMPRLTSATNFLPDISMISTISSSISSETADEGPTTPRKFLSFMTVMDDLFMLACISGEACMSNENSRSRTSRLPRSDKGNNI